MSIDGPPVRTFNAGGMRPSVIERAFELASSGRCKSLNEIEAALRKENYEFVYIHMRGLALRKALRTLLRNCEGQEDSP